MRKSTTTQNETGEREAVTDQSSINAYFYTYTYAYKYIHINIYIYTYTYIYIFITLKTVIY